MFSLYKFRKIVILAIFIYLNFTITFASNEKIDPNLLNKEGETTVIVTFSKKPLNYKNFIKSIGGEMVHDYNIIEGLAVKIEGKNIPKLLNMSNVLRIQENKKVKALLHDSAPLISANDVWEKGITGKDVKVCVLDTGVNYSHPAIDPYCEFKTTINGTIEPYVLQSPHLYPASYNYTWNITRPGFTKITVHFVNISIEVAPPPDPQGDFLYIKDANGNTVQTFIGDYKDVWSVSVPGDTIKINLVSDWYGCRYGFYIDKITDGDISQEFENCTKIINGYDFVNNDKDSMDDNGHGTHVTGIITSNDAYSRGIANGTKILAAKVLDSSGNGDYASVMAGLDWCVENSAQIISMSLGGDTYLGNCDEDNLANAVNNVVDKGIVVAVAAGNEGSCGITTPGCASKVIAAGAIDKNKNVAGYSSKGLELDIVAPGSSINSTYFNRWASISGTSMAAPHISGVIALMLEADPFLSPSYIKEVIKQTADPVSKCYDSYQLIGSVCTKIAETEIPCTENVTGAGIINASRAVDMVLIDSSAPRYSEIKEPIDPSIYSSTALYNFSIKWTDDKAVDTVIFEFNGTNYTDLNKERNVYSKSFEGLPIGFYEYKWYANDTSGKWNETELLNFTVEIDETPPVIIMLSPQNKTYHTILLPLNFIVNEPTSRIDYSLDCKSNVTITGNTIFNTTNGPHNIIVYANDSYGSVGASDKVYFTVVVDTTPPILIFVPPTPENIVINKNFAFINITLNELLSNATLEWNGINETMLGSGINWYKNKTSLVNGNYTYRVFGSDLSGNSNRTDFRWVKIDTAPPNVAILSPQNNTSYYKTYIPLNFTITNSTPISWIGYSLNNTPNVTIIGPINLTGLANGWNNITIFANDTSGNMGSSNKIYFFYCQGDIDNNKVVGLSDIVAMSKIYGKKCGDAGYDDRADLNGDCSVGLADLVILSKQYGKSC
jgi:subtilisin family serine protease